MRWLAHAQQLLTLSTYTSCCYDGSWLHVQPPFLHGGSAVLAGSISYVWSMCRNCHVDCTCIAMYITILSVEVLELYTIKIVVLRASACQTQLHETSASASAWHADQVNGALTRNSLVQHEAVVMLLMRNVHQSNICAT